MLIGYLRLVIFLGWLMLSGRVDFFTVAVGLLLSVLIVHLTWPLFTGGRALRPSPAEENREGAGGAGGHRIQPGNPGGEVDRSRGTEQSPAGGVLAPPQAVAGRGVRRGLVRVAAVTGYMPVFLLQVLQATLDVARHALAREVSVKPGIIRIPTTLRCERSVTLLSSLITLTPGTVTLDFDPRRRVLYVHCLDLRGGNDPAHIIGEVRKLERWVWRIME